MSLITIEGLDGVGKSTYMNMLDNYFKTTKASYHLISFPRYNNIYALYAQMYLSGLLTKDNFDNNPYLTSTFFAIDRYLSYKESWEQLYNNKKSIIICNRYVDSNIIYQGAKLNNINFKKYLNWINNFEYKILKLPVPEITLFLKMPFDFIQSTINKRNKNNDFDIHESNIKYLFKCYELANSMAKNKNWKIIYCYDKNGNIRSMNDIFEDIKKEIMNFIC